MGTEHDRLVLTESCGQAQVRRACWARPVSRNTEIVYVFTKETTEAKINKHKRRKKLRANRHKKRTWQK